MNLLPFILAYCTSAVWAISWIREVYVPDSDQVSLQWDIGPLSDATMFIENTEHYALDTEQGIAEWAALVPPDGGIIRIPGHEHQPVTISLFHQLRCLDVLRGAVVASLQNHTQADAKAVHCLNYLRQMVLCRADRYVENVRDPKAEHAVQFMGEKTCKDWTQVYAALGS